MTLPLNSEILEQAYEYLRTTPPFRSWNLPEGEDVRFRVVRDPSLRGWYNTINGRHVIAISSRCIGHTSNLIQTMAHEMIHLHQDSAGMATCSQHNAAFVKFSEQVCKLHGFDPKLF